MKQEIVLPKFKIPGQANWLVRGLWIGGGVVVLLTLLVVLGLAKQKGEREAAEAMRQQTEQAAAATAAAEAARAPAPKPRAASKMLASTKAPLTRAALEPGKPALAKPGAGLGGKTKARARAGYTYRKKPTRQSKLFATKAAAKGGAGARPAAKAKAPAAKGKGGDAIDDILRNFK